MAAGPKVGYHSPLQPAKTGVADYAAALLASLRSLGSVEVAPAHADVRLYHIGNNRLHRAIYARALAEPGVVVLHDALLQHFFLGWLDETSYVEEFVYNYGEWTRGLAGAMWRGKARSALQAEYYEYPMLKRIAERSRAVIVHNPAAARIVRSHAPSARVVEIPHLFAEPELPSMSEALRFRQRLGIPAGAFVYGVFGYLRESKRVMGVLRAFGRVHAEQPGTALLLAGEYLSTDLERAVRPWLREPGVAHIGHMTESEFWLAAQAADACINLRWPSAGETSGITIRMMGIGKPVLLTAGEEVSRLPEDACLRIDPGPAEEEMLACFMLWLKISSGAAGSLGESAREYIFLRHSVPPVAKLYWETLCAS